MSKPKPPSQKEVVQLLCTYIGEQEKDVLNPKTREKERRSHLAYRCLSTNCTNGPDRMITFQKSAGYQNPYSHLKRCVGQGDESHLLQVFHENKSKKSVSSFFIPVVPSESKSNKINALYDWISIIVEKNLPIQSVEDPLLRQFSKHSKQRISRVILKSVILRLVKLVEIRIAKEMKEAGCGSILVHDGWSHNSVHYVGLFASFIKKIDSTPRLVLLSVSPLARFLIRGRY